MEAAPAEEVLNVRPVNAERPSRRPIIVLIVTAFLGYGSMVPLPLLLLSPHPVSVFTLTLVWIGLAACLVLLVLPRWRVSFQLTALALALWSARGIYAIAGMLGRAFSASPDPLWSACALIGGIGAICALFYCYAFGGISRRYYGFSKRPVA